MTMFHRVTAACTILSVEKVGRAWIDARKAEAAAEKRLENARARRDAALRDLAALVERFPASVPDAYDKFMKATSSAIEIDAAFAALGKSRNTTREAFNALRDLFGRASGDVSETMAAVDEIKKRSEQEKAAAREYLANCERLRGQMQGEG